MYIGEDSAYYLYRNYYKSGQLKSEGNTLKSGALQGIWKYFYSDGQLKWKGQYKIGNRVYDELNYDTLDAKLTPLGEKEVIPNEPFKFRIYVDKVHPYDYIVTKFFNGRVDISNIEDDDFPYTLTLTDEELQLCDKTNPNNICDTLLVMVHFPPGPYDEDNPYDFMNLPVISFSVPIR
jgi:hypothetical protein